MQPDSSYKSLLRAKATRISSNRDKYASVANANANLEQSRVKLIEQFARSNSMVASLRNDLESPAWPTKSSTDDVLVTNLQDENRKLRDMYRCSTATLQGQLDLVVSKHEVVLVSLAQKDAKCV